MLRGGTKLKILCIDTSSDICSVCIYEENNVIAIKELKNGKTHSENLMILIEETLNTSGLILNDIDALACSIGPGSFTGIRIGISAIKAISEVVKLPIIAVTSLEALTENEEFEGVVCTVIDANNNQVYAGIFRENTLLEDYLADDIDIVLGKVDKYKNNNILFIGDGAVRHKDKIYEEFGIKANFTEKNEQTSISIGKIAIMKYKNEELYTADTILPLYLRKSQAERMKELGGNNN